jgi:CheY-like chemotaxis protein
MLRFLRRKGSVLLLDDDAAIQRLVSTLLRRAGYRVEVVGKGNEAIRALKSAEFSAIILDLMMPHEGGMTVIRHLRETRPELLHRVIVLTATPEAVLRGIEGEVFAIVHKPFEPAQLVETVARLG